ncbi:PaaI family thioesterase [Capnocytophaga bilenii]|jgi:thioesterase superfamily protein|uniref:PaaI family thioesterase n=1 Tax=Capnocytophaga bilenii TaxID=2819369 RepID=UPI0028D34A54|nr:PaaI family thioesterase [Capnocytophaga bilenii]
MNKQDLQQKWDTLPENNLMRLWEMEIAEVGEDYLVMTMPVTDKVTQIDGVLHGGATLALAETAGSVAAFLLHRKPNEQIRGIELSANHLRSGKIGDTLFATAKCINAGRTLQLWEINITNQDNKLISYCKFTTIKI